MSTPWHDEANQLRKSGMMPRVIAHTLSRKVDAVRWVLNENNEQERTRERARGVRRRRSSGEARQPSSSNLKTRRSEWQIEARQMHAAGVPAHEIADKFGKNLGYVLNIIKGLAGSGDILGAGPDVSFIKPFVARQPRQICADTMGACRAFAAGEIDRAEPSRRLRGDS
jgi:hypothetical protein